MSDKPNWRCETCKHRTFDTPDNTLVCGRIKGPQHEDECILDEEPASCMDGSGYLAELRITDSFGCVLWEPKEGN